MARGILKVRIIGDARDLDRELRRAGTQIQSAATGIEKAGKKISDAGGKLTTRVSLPLVALGGVAFKAASDLNESMSKVNIVFGKSGKVVTDFAKTAATSLGQSQQQALEAAGTFGNLFRAMGTGQAPAAQMSTQLVKLASDLASFNNADPSEVLEALRSGLVGEAEPLRRFGIQISAARIQAEAFALGIAKPTVDLVKLRGAQLKASEAAKVYGETVKKYGKDAIEAAKAQQALDKATQDVEKALQGNKTELTAAQKAQASFSLIMKDSTLAQGDFARTSDGAANKTRILKAQFQDAAATLGTKLLPVGEKLIGFATDLLKKFEGLSPGMQDFIIKGAAIAIALGPVVKIVGILTRGVGLLHRGLGAVSRLAPGAAGGVTAIGKAAQTAAPAVATVATAGQAVPGVLKGIGAAAKTALPNVLGLVGGFLQLQTLLGEGSPLRKIPNLAFPLAPKSGAPDIDPKALESQLTSDTDKRVRALIESFKAGKITLTQFNKEFALLRDFASPAAVALGIAARNSIALRAAQETLAKQLIASGLAAQDLNIVLRSLPADLQIKVIEEGLREGTINADNFGKALKDLPKEVQAEVIATSISREQLKVEDFGAALKGLPKSVRTQVAHQLVDDRNISIKQFKRILDGLQIHGKLRTKILADVAANVKAKVTSVSITKSAAGGFSLIGGTQQYHSGGPVSGYGRARGEVPALLEEGEFVFSRTAVARIGLARLEELHRAATRTALRRLHSGGPVGGSARWPERASHVDNSVTQLIVQNPIPDTTFNSMQAGMRRLQLMRAH